MVFTRICHALRVSSEANPKASIFSRRSPISTRTRPPLSKKELRKSLMRSFFKEN
jgi:hypothetical protein